MRNRAIVATVILASRCAVADEPLYRYEGDLVPSAAGWLVYDVCEGYCTESVENGRFVLRWGKLGNFANYTYVVSGAPNDAPSSLWVEWRLRSNVPIPRFADDCDAHFVVNYRALFDVMFLFGDAIVSFSGDDWLLDLALDEFHTYRFESPNGVDYWFSVDGVVFYETYGDDPQEPYAALQFGGGGGCGETRPPDPRNEWDFIRYGTISYGERIVASEPPGGFLDPCLHPALDRFTVRFEEANYVYVDEITVDVRDVGTQGLRDEEQGNQETRQRGNKATERRRSVPRQVWSGPATATRQQGNEAVPIVTATRRLDNGPPEVVEIVLDGPIPAEGRTVFTFDDGAITQTVAYTYVQGDSDADGDFDLRDFAAYVNCFGTENVTGPCYAFDFDDDALISQSDVRTLTALLNGPV